MNRKYDSDRSLCNLKDNSYQATIFTAFLKAKAIISIFSLETKTFLIDIRFEKQLVAMRCDAKEQNYKDIL